MWVLYSSSSSCRSRKRKKRCIIADRLRVCYELRALREPMLRALRGAGCSVLRVSHVRFFMLARSKRKRGFLYEKYSFVSMPSGGATQISIQIAFTFRSCKSNKTCTRHFVLWHYASLTMMKMVTILQ